MDGVRINSPHYLARIKVPAGDNYFTLVVSQYEKHKNIHYTLRAYGINEFKFAPIKNPYNSTQRVSAKDVLRKDANVNTKTEKV